MVKILFISQYFYPEQFSNNAIARELIRRGHSVLAVPCVPNYPQGTFFEGYSNFERRDEIWEGVKIRRVRTFPRGKSAWRLVLNFVFYPLAALSKIAFSEGRAADVSFVSLTSPLFQAFAGVWARKIWGIPTVYWVQDIWPETIQNIFELKDGILLKLLDMVCRWIYLQADLILIQNPSMAPLIERHGVSLAKIRVLHNTAPSFYKPLDRECFPNILKQMPAEKFRLLFAGNVGESQGLDVLVEAASIIRQRHDIAFVIVGDGRALPDLETKIVGLGLQQKFTFCGRRPEEEMPCFFACADALFVSLRPFPNFELTVPYKVQTYLACGKPIIASLSGEGARVVKEARAGFICDSGDAKALASAIERLADVSARDRQQMGDNARRYFEENYSSKIVYDTLENALNDIAMARRIK